MFPGKMIFSILHKSKCQDRQLQLTTMAIRGARSPEMIRTDKKTGKKAVYDQSMKKSAAESATTSRLRL